MALESGSRLGPYEILTPIGAGGMGEVYRARDTRLDRTVSIKVLPSHLSDNADLKQRFKREARAVSSLNHPHICTLHDIGSQEGVDYLVMEYLGGETLAERLKKGALPVDRALRHAVEIADALDKAHRQGVVHRDLKPGNIMLTDSGAKLLDFGLAKFREDVSAETPSVLSDLPTQQKPLTEQGTILGTFQYMAPEQLEGKEADVRTDIFAFGAVLYEMLTGKKAFEGKSQASLITAIMSSEPQPVSAVQKMSPPMLDHVVQRCLAKEPDERWQTTSDVMRELKWVSESNTQPGTLPPWQTRRRNSRRIVAIGILCTLAGALLASIVVRNVMRQEARPPARFAIKLPESDQLAKDALALSPDGKNLVYVGIRNGVRQLYRRSMDKIEAEVVPGTEGAAFPFFSPDGRQIGFFADGKLRKVNFAGGLPVTVCGVSGNDSGASWGPDDSIIFSSLSDYLGLQQVPASGGSPRPLTSPDRSKNELHGYPEILPGGEVVLFVIRADSLQVAVRSLDTGEQRILVEGSNPRYTSTGHILYLRDNSLWAVAFDARELTITGSPTRVLERVQTRRRTSALFAVANNGSLVFASGSSEGNTLVWVDREGKAAPLIEEERDYRYPRLSPDCKRLAVAVRSNQPAADSDIWIYDIERGTRIRLTTEGPRNVDSAWTPDGNRIVFDSDRSGDRDLYWKRADGTGEAEVLVERDNNQVKPSWSPNGEILVFDDQSANDQDLWLLPRGGDPVPFLATRFREDAARFSLDGRWIAYSSNESGQFEIYVRPYPGPGEKWAISTDGGEQPVWSPAGVELFYRNGDRMMVVAIATEPEFSAGVPQLLFEGRFESPSDNPDYDVSRDGQRFVMVQSAEPTEIHVVLNWFDELKRLVPVEN